MAPLPAATGRGGWGPAALGTAFSRAWLHLPLLSCSQAASRSTRRISSWGPPGCEAGGGTSCRGASARSGWWAIGCLQRTITNSTRGSATCTSASIAPESTAREQQCLQPAVSFCGIAVRIKPASTQLSSQCFVQPLLPISTQVPRSCCCSRPELLCAPSVISDLLLASVPTCIPELDPLLLWILARLLASFHIPDSHILHDNFSILQLRFFLIAKFFKLMPRGPANMSSCSWLSPLPLPVVKCE